MRKEATVNEFKNNINRMLEEVNESDEIIYIKDENYSCVIICEKEYNRLINKINEIDQYEDEKTNQLNQHILNELNKCDLTNKHMELLRSMILEICIEYDLELIKFEEGYYDIDIFFKDKNEKEKQSIIYENELLTLDDDHTEEQEQHILNQLKERLK